MTLGTDIAIPASLENPLEQLLGYQLRRASLVMLADLTRCVADLDLTVTEMSVLLLIEANPQITQSEIGRILAIQRANMTPLAARLVRRDLIEREAVDGRSNGLRVTPAGSAIIEKLRTRIEDNESRFLARVPPQARPQLMSLLNALWREHD